jgi:[ribosomal protein S5]-alanine N-acetyltransferase
LETNKRWMIAGFDPYPTLQTERLVLRQLTSADATEIFKLRSDDHVNEYVDRQRPQSIDDALAFIHRINTAIFNNEMIFWAIVPRQQQKLVGTIVLWNISPELQRAELGYELLPECEGQGIMKEAFEEVLAYGFEVMKLQSIEAFTRSTNERSLKLLGAYDFIHDTVAETNRPDELGRQSIYTLERATWKKRR